MMLIKENLQEFVQEKLGEYLFVVVSNRQPYEHVYKKGKVECQRPSGGVITAIDPVMQACHGLWIAASSGEADHRVTDSFNKIEVPVNNPAYTLKRVWLTKPEEEGYYYGYSNDALWPLCHTAFQRPIFKQEDWQHYINVNQKFARAVMEEIGPRKAFIWIQDYHFCLLPKLLKEMADPNQLIIAHFWHIPWPSYESFRICPQKDEILEGMLANDMIGFHTHSHCNNFLEVVDRQLESKIDRERFSVIRRDHETLIRPYPISVDFEEINQQAQSDDIERIENDLIEEFHLGNCRLLLGVDRIDYTKGIPERLSAIDRLFEKHPELKGKIVFFQLGVLSRIHIAKYKALNDEINSLVERINWKHSTEDWNPVILIRGNMSSLKLLALYRMAEVCVVSALHDGMNLVAKEFVCAHCDDDGVLVLSQFTGSARELTEATLINPYDCEQFSDSIYQALTMPEEERRKRMAKMRQTVHENNIFRWAAKFLSGLLKIEFKEQEEVKV
jgi:trehalose 6-phosphate synthase